MAWRNLAFWYFNPLFAVTLAVFCAVFAWLLHANAQIKGSTLPEFRRGADGFWGRVSNYLELVVVTPAEKPDARRVARSCPGCRGAGSAR